eukprot:3351885-Rhodomonas_salina.1
MTYGAASGVRMTAFDAVLFYGLGKGEELRGQFPSRAFADSSVDITLDRGALHCCEMKSEKHGCALEFSTLLVASFIGVATTRSVMTRGEQRKDLADRA